MNPSPCRAEPLRQRRFERGVGILLVRRDGQPALLQFAQRTHERFRFALRQEAAFAQHARVRRAAFRVERQELLIRHPVVADREGVHLLIERQSLGPKQSQACAASRVMSEK